MKPTLIDYKKLRARVRALEDWLRKHGKHTRDCARMKEAGRIFKSGEPLTLDIKVACDCGLHDLLREGT